MLKRIALALAMVIALAIPASAAGWSLTDSHSCAQAHTGWKYDSSTRRHGALQKTLLDIWGLDCNLKYKLQQYQWRPELGMYYWTTVGYTTIYLR